MSCANHPDREHVAFCQNCGKAICAECSRVIGQAVFCEPCLAARLSGAGAPFQGRTTFAGTGGGWTTTGSTPGSEPIPPPTAPGEPNPGLAALLGFIPGVGAFYNGQYAKGVIHLIVFAILISLADQHGIFGLFIAGWVFYQVIEAHHTARARRDGTPLPNPFGLNDIGERLGFGKSWPSSGPAAVPGYQAPPPASAESAYGSGSARYTAPPGVSPYPGPAQSAAWGAPENTYAGAEYSVPQDPAYGPSMPSDFGAAAPVGRRLPTGAFVLIGLGAFFLIANTGHFEGIAIQWFVPVLLIGLGVWIFVRRMTAAGMSLGDDGSPMYRYRLYSALRGSVWLALVGVLFFLDLAQILTWSRSWPLFIVVAGVIGLVKRAAFASLPVTSFPGAQGADFTPPATPPSTPSTELRSTDSAEDRNRS